MKIISLPEIFLVFCLSLPACGELVHNQTAEAKCENLIEVWCEKEAECSAYWNEESCQSTARAKLDCGTAIATSGSYDQCLREIERVDCDSFSELPESCSGVIKTVD